jgi:uncharacterized protein YbjT (DUF2867 family)
MEDSALLMGAPARGSGRGYGGAMSKRALVAGVSGVLGSKVAAELMRRGWSVRGLTRDKTRAGAVSEVQVGDALDPRTLEGAADGVDLVFSAVGASVSPALSAGWAPFTSLDVRANRALIDEAKRAGVNRFVYVSVHHTQEMLSTPYVRAHEDVVKLLEASGLDFCVVRPTGFYAALAAAFLDFAKKGAVPAMGDGQTKSNPIDEADLALVCADACEGTETFVSAGGPEVMTRDQMAEKAFEALGKPPKLRRAPLGVVKVASVLMRPFHPRMAQMMAFVASLSENDCVAPVRGKRTLGEYYREAAARSSSLT